MSRSRRRISRALLGLLACTIALGLVFWLHNLNKTRAAEQANAAAANAAVVAPPPAREPAPQPAPEPAPADPAQPIALVTQTPTAAAPTRPVRLPPRGTITITPSSPSTTQPARQYANATPLAPRPAAATPIHSSKPLADAQARIDAGDLLTARTILNTALLDNQISPADTAAVKKMLAEVNKSIVFSPRRFNDDEYGSSYTVKSGDVMQKIAAQYDVTWQLLCRLNGLTRPERMRAGQTLKIIRGPFHAVVDKSEFTMEIYLGSPGEAGSVFVTSYRVGLGADDSTPTGTWSVEPQRKITNPVYYSPRGQGVIEADDPANPLGEFWIGLTGIDGHAVGKESYGIHGTIEPDSIGKQASMGCIRLGKDDITLVFELLAEGKSTVIVRE